MADKNALTELANRLAEICYKTKIPEDGKYVDLARRIVAELAKVGFNERGQPRDEWIACEAVENCRAIAEEGGDDAVR